jgi:hypothetical protein
MHRLRTFLLWLAAFFVAVALAAFQRMTGPTYPARGSVELEGIDVAYSLRRSHGGDGGLMVRLGAPAGVHGDLEWRRWPSEEPWRDSPLVRRDGVLEAEIPHQPPAGKVEYRLVVTGSHGRVVVPAGEAVVARFRGDVPAGVLIPHVLCMFASMLLATRSLLEVGRAGHRNPAALVLTSMGFLVAGGLILGPVVQNAAFGALWTGWPYGTDLTDNKTAIAVLAWLPATILALRRRPLRVAVCVGWVVMMGVFLIPHSMRGSQIDWSQPPVVASPVSDLPPAGSRE